MPNYICVKNNNHERIQLCRYEIDNEILDSIEKMIDDIQNKGDIIEERLSFDVMNAMKVNNVPSRSYIDLVFNLKYNERVEYIDSKEDGVGMAPVHGPNCGMEEDDFYKVQYYRYFLHPLIAINNNLNNALEFVLPYNLKKLLSYSLNGTDTERYYADKILSSLCLKETDLDKPMYQFYARMLLLAKNGAIYNKNLNKTAISSNELEVIKGKQKTKR